jgi:HD-GYP domain-containing protein (c-di-GMP phosphodiesterase class II)
MNTNLLEQAQRFIRFLVSAVSSTCLYSPGHRYVLKQTDEAFSSLMNTFGEQDEIVLMVLEGELVFDNTPLDRSMYINRFIQFLVAKGIEYLKISRSVEVSELQLLIELLALQGHDLYETQTMRHIYLKKLERNKDFFGQGEDAESGFPLEAIPAHERVLFKEILDCIEKNEPFSMVGVEEIVRSCILAFRKDPVSFPYLSPLVALDTYTFTHSTNVCALNLSQAMALGIEGRLLHDIGVAGILHDVGKLFIPKEILAKPAALSDAEMAIVSQHSLLGAHYLLTTPGVPKLAVVCAFEHHMGYDGAGYPVPSVIWQQNVCSQMTAISDFFDALRTKRVYRDPVHHDKVAALLADGAGTRFNPELTRSFLGILKKYRAFDASVVVSAESSPKRNPLTEEPRGAGAGAGLAQ